MTEDSFNESNAFRKGWAYFKTLGDSAPPAEGCDLQEWMKGFCAALADYNNGEYETIMLALLDLGIDADLLEDCLKAVENVRLSGEWSRWPSMPIRGWGQSKGQPDSRRVLIV